MADDQEVSWRVLEEGTEVHSRDGEEIGKVSSVVADDEKDIFSGIAFRSGVLGPQRFVPAARITEITRERVVVDASSSEAEDFEDHDG